MATVTNDHAQGVLEQQILKASNSESRAAAPLRREGGSFLPLLVWGSRRSWACGRITPTSLGGHTGSSAASSPPLPPYEDAGTAFAGHPDNLLIAKSLTCSHLRPLSLEDHIRVLSLGPAVWGTCLPLRPAVHQADLPGAHRQRRRQRGSGRGQRWLSAQTLTCCTVVVWSQRMHGRCAGWLSPGLWVPAAPSQCQLPASRRRFLLGMKL